MTHNVLWFLLWISVCKDHLIIPAQHTQLKVNPWKRGTRSYVTRGLYGQLPHMVV